MILIGESGIRSILVNDSPEAFTWTEGQFEQVRQNAESVFFRNSSSSVLLIEPKAVNDTIRRG